MTAAAFDPNRPQPGYQQFQQPGMPPQQGFPGPAPYPSADPKDHTAEFDPKDISDNKVFAMAPYLLGIVGIIIALLAAQKSDFAMFHVRQALKLELLSVLVVICMIVPVLGWIFAPIASIILFVVQVIMFFRVCKGRAIEPPIVSSLGFLK